MTTTGNLRRDRKMQDRRVNFYTYSHENFSRFRDFYPEFIPSEDIEDYSGSFFGVPVVGVRNISYKTLLGLIPQIEGEFVVLSDDDRQDHLAGREGNELFFST